MADAVATVLVEPIISMIEQWIKEEISLVRGAKKNLENVSSKLKTIRTVLEDAEKRSVQDKLVKDWLEELKDISYEMDDVLDEWNTTISKQKLAEEAENPSDVPKEKISCSSFYTYFVSSFKSCHPCFPFKQVGLRRDIALKIRQVDACLGFVIQKKQDFNFVLKYPPQKPSDVDSLKSERITTSIIEEPDIYGRDVDKETLLRMLLSEQSQEANQNVPVISIVGGGGIGKTALAKQVYNDDKVVKRFNDKRIWVCVSNHFDVVEVAREILVAIRRNNIPSYSPLNMLLTELKQSISNQRFLLVLDDVWDEKGKNREKLKSCLVVGAVESRILVTTRKYEVAEVMGTTTNNLHRIGYLSAEASWTLFEKRAFAKKNKEDSLEKIGREIVKKCLRLATCYKDISKFVVL